MANTTTLSSGVSWCVTYSNMIIRRTYNLLFFCEFYNFADDGCFATLISFKILSPETTEPIFNQNS